MQDELLTCANFDLYYVVNIINMRPVRSIFYTPSSAAEVAYVLSFHTPNFELYISEDARRLCDFSKWTPSFNQRFK